MEGPLLRRGLGAPRWKSEAERPHVRGMARHEDLQADERNKIESRRMIHLNPSLSIPRNGVFALFTFHGRLDLGPRRLLRKSPHPSYRVPHHQFEHSCGPESDAHQSHRLDGLRQTQERDTFHDEVMNHSSPPLKDRKATVSISVDRQLALGADPRSGEHPESLQT